LNIIKQANKEKSPASGGSLIPMSFIGMGMVTSEIPSGACFVILYHSFSFEHQAGKCQAETAGNNDRR